MNAVETGLRLDARQCAMLEAMGIDLLGIAAPARAPRPAPTSATPAARAAAPAPTMAPAPGAAAAAPPAAPARAAAVARPAPPAAKPRAPAASSAASAAVWLGAPQRLYGGDADAAPGGWLVVADLPPPDAAHPAANDARRLLDNMLRALGLHTAGVPVHLACAHRGAAPRDDAPAFQPFDEAIAAMLPALAPRVLLALGPLAAQRLLGRREPIGKLRGGAQPLPAWPQAQVIASYPLDYLLRNGADKAKAWADLCAAAEAFETVDRR